MSSNFAGSTAKTPPPQPSPRDGSHHHRDGYASPHRHHHRVSSHHRPVKETRNARTQYSNSEDDGASQLRINQYLISQEIGRGSFGAVHLATDQYGNEYAVKEFSKTRLRRRAKSNMLRRPRGRPSPISPVQHGFHHLLDSTPSSPGSPVSANDNSFDLIKEEIAIMKKLNHPNLVSLIEVLDDPADDSLFMVLEMCKKGVIMKVEADETVDPYSDHECRTWFRDLILGIEYLHAQGVIHRDIKPDNCLLTEDGTLKVSDFGVSEMFEKASDMRTAKSAGSPAFMAPELCQVSKGHISGSAADIWSMGVTLYCLKFGRVPFQKTAVLDLYNAVLNDPIDLPEDCEASFKDLMFKLFEKKPEKRIKMRELREHPWVTMDGSDPLLSAEENCATLVEPPTEAEVSAAITGNLGRVMAVMKAVNRFKALIEKRRPELVNSILGHASRFVRPPGTIRHRPDIMKSRSESAAADEGAIKRKDVQSAKAIYDRKGDSQGAEIAEKLDMLPEKLKSSVIENLQVEAPEEPVIKAIREDAVHQKLHRAHTDPLEDTEAMASSSQALSPQAGRGHAHDPLEDHLYLSVGTGHGPNASEELDEADNNESQDCFFVSESPPTADFNIYEKAYEQEVKNIQRTRGREATIYLTRRVERHVDKLVAELGRHEEGSPASPFRQGVSSILGKALEKSGYIDKEPGSGKHGLNNVLDKAMAKAKYTPDQTLQLKEGVSGLVGSFLEKSGRSSSQARKAQESAKAENEK